MSGSYQISQDIDIISLRKIFAKGDNNTTLPANNMLTTDGFGGTLWTDVGTLEMGTSFNTITTISDTFTAGLGTTAFNFLDNGNILFSTISTNTVTPYAKSFGEISIGGSTISAFNSTTGTVNANLSFQGTGIIQGSADTTTNQITFYAPNDATSSLSTLIQDMDGLNSTISSCITRFHSPFAFFIYDAISSFSTTTNFTTKTLNTSTLKISGQRQPFTQYGSNSLNSGTSLISLGTPYADTSYGIQLTYTGPSGYSKPLSSSGITTSNFTVNGDSTGSFYWTTYGNLF